MEIFGVNIIGLYCINPNAGKIMKSICFLLYIVHQKEI